MAHIADYALAADGEFAGGEEHRTAIRAYRRTITPRRTGGVTAVDRLGARDVGSANMRSVPVQAAAGPVTDQTVPVGTGAGWGRLGWVRSVRWRGVDEGVVVVPIFLVERRFAEDLEASAEVADRINRINEEEGVRWFYSFLSADKRKTYCLYEAPMADAIRRAAARAGLPADAVVELGGRVLPDGSLAGLPTG